jgi:hypothetical protein
MNLAHAGVVQKDVASRHGPLPISIRELLQFDLMIARADRIQ